MIEARMLLRADVAVAAVGVKARVPHMVVIPLPASCRARKCRVQRKRTFGRGSISRSIMSPCMSIMPGISSRPPPPNIRRLDRRLAHGGDHPILDADGTAFDHAVGKDQAKIRQPHIRRARR